MQRFYALLLMFLTSITLNTAFADMAVTMHLTTKKETGKSIGTIDVTQTKYGLLFTPHLTDLTPGTHGFHIHQGTDCSDMGMAAGGHFDPDKSQQHLGPYQQGHLGDLPPLIVNKDGSATLPVLAPRLRLDDVKNHSLMIHVGSDNYADSPEKLGGGGTRLACGVIK